MLLIIIRFFIFIILFFYSRIFQVHTCVSCKPVFKSTFRGVMLFSVFLGRGQNVLLCFLMDLISPGINNEWSLRERAVCHLGASSDNNAQLNYALSGKTDLLITKNRIITRFRETAHLPSSMPTFCPKWEVLMLA